MSMATVEYWDENEFNYFETLEDEDKLLYVYDLMIDEPSYLEIHTEMEELDRQEREISEMFKKLGEAASEMEDDEDDYDFKRDRNEVRVELVKSTDKDTVYIYGPTLGVLLKVATDLQMNGMLLMDKKIEFTKYEPWGVILSYTVIGNVPPFSVN